MPQLVVRVSSTVISMLSLRVCRTTVTNDYGKLIAPGVTKTTKNCWLCCGAVHM